MAKKTKGWLDNYNDYSVSAPEGFQGDGFDMTGRNYSPAWGGQFEMGGNIPEAQVGKDIKLASDATSVKLPEIVQRNVRQPLTKEQQLQLASEANAKQQRINERKAAVAAIDNKKSFKLPTGETKTYDKMTGREKKYVEGKALEQRGRFFENEENFFDEYLNPLNLLGTMAGGFGRAPLEAKMSNSNRPYVSALATPLVTGALASLGTENIGQFLNNAFNPIPFEHNFKFKFNLSKSNPSLEHQVGFSDNILNGLKTSDKTIRTKGSEILNELRSDEGMKRLRNQFKLSNPDASELELDYLVNSRLDEVGASLTYNQPRFVNEILDVNKNTFNRDYGDKLLENYFPKENAHWSPINPYPNLYQAYGYNKPSRFNLLKSDRGTTMFQNYHFEPGSITLGRGFENNAMTLDHEIGHAIQKGGRMPVDDELAKLLPQNNEADSKFIDIASKITKDRNLKSDKEYFDFAGGRSIINERYPFLREQRRKMLERGIINNIYDEITPYKLFKARLAAITNKSYNYMEGDRLVKLTPFWKYPELAKIMNTAPAAIPAIAVGAAAATGSEEVPQQEFGGSIPGATGMMYARHGAPSNGPYAKKTMPSAQDGSQIDPIAQEMKSYVESPLYLQRLKGMKVNDPELLQQSRANNLKNVTFTTGPSDNTNVDSHGWPLVTLKPGSSEYTKAHELGHAISSYGGITNVSSMTEAGSNQMSPREAWYIMNRNVNTAKTPYQINPLASEKNKTVRENAWDLQHDDKNKLYSSISPFPNSGPLEGIDITSQYHGKLDPHDVNAGENYGDLTALRHALLKQGYTKSFGENLSQETLNKAFQDQKIKNIKQVQRMRRNFNDASILDINNKIAYQDNNQGDVFARDGASVYYQYGLDFTPKSMKNGGQTKNERDMVNGIADILSQVNDPQNRAQIAKEMVKDFKNEDVTYDYDKFMQMSNLKNGGEMIKRADGSYSRRGLWDNIRANIGSKKKPTKEMLKQEKKIKAKSKQDGGPIPIDPLGYWNPDNVGNPVIIPSTDITMKGVDQDLIGVSNTGDVKRMKKGKNYKFDGDYVTEYPTMQYGGELTKLDQLTNFTNYNTKQPGGWLDKYK